MVGAGPILTGSGVSRRGILRSVGALTVAGGLAAATGCTNPNNAAGSGPGLDTAAGPFEFVDDAGRHVRLPGKPRRIVAYAGSAASLWEYGIRPVAVFGPQRLSDGRPDPQVGEVDVNSVTSLGNAYGEFDVPKYIQLAPELLVSGISNKPGLWYVPNESFAEITGQAASVGITMQRNARHAINRYQELAAALGADINAEPVRRAREGLDAATARLAAAAQAKPGLRVLAFSGSKEKPWIGNPLSHGSLIFARDTGVPLTNVGDQPASLPWVTDLSWEQINQFPADLILYDVRTQALTLDQMRQIEVFNKLPAVQAGALAPWRVEAPYTYRAYTQVANELADAIERARVGIA